MVPRPGTLTIKKTVRAACAEGKGSYLARRLLEEREDPPPQLPVKSRVELEGGRPLARLHNSSETGRRDSVSALLQKRSSSKEMIVYLSSFTDQSMGEKLRRPSS